MFKRILVPLDNSALAERALAPAALLAKRCEADLLLVGATRERAFPGLLTGAAPRQTDKIERYLSVAATLLSAEGVPVNTAVLCERPAKGIAAHSEDYDVDLIVMATHGRTGLEALLHSSVTWDVLGLSPVPVLALKPPTEEEESQSSPRLPRFLTEPAAPIIVPLDGSQLAERALPLAQKLAWLYAHPLVLVRAVSLPYLAGGVIDYPMVLTNLQEYSLEESGAYLKRKQKEIACTGLEVRTESMFGEAAACIEACVQNYHAGLVVMASRGRGGLGRLLLGSVARRVLNRVDVPILLVPAAQSLKKRAEEIA